MGQWGFYFNQDRCVGCKTCVLSCKQWNEKFRGDAAFNIIDYGKYKKDVGADESADFYTDPESGAINYKEYRKYYMKEMWRDVERFETGSTVRESDFTFSATHDIRYLSLGCNHCDTPACVDACPMGVHYKDEETGIVLWNNEACISCGKCKDACPWDKPQFYDDNFANYAQDDASRPKMTKCTLCYERINEGLKPSCVAACWNRALDAGPIEELKAKYPDALDSIVEFDNGSTGPNILFKAKAEKKA